MHSYSLKSHPYDNALIENFHSMLKREWVFHQKFISIAHARLSIIKYIEWFNHERISYREMAKMQIS
ncbi:integrase core domain-containing protein [Lactobacillaceae bacterium Melli_B4]